MLAIGPLTGLALFIFRFCTGNHPSGCSASSANSAPSPLSLRDISPPRGESPLKADKVTVSAPETVAFDIDVTFYIPQPDAASATVIAAATTQAVEEYVTWQTSKMGRDINPSYLTAKLMEAGVKRVEVRKPVFTVVDDIKVAKLGNKSVLNGGIENV